VKIGNRQQLLVAAAIGGIALLITDRLVFTPLTNLWKDSSAKITDLRKQVEDGTSLIQREQAIRRRWQEMQKNTLPNNASLAEQQILKAFDTWSRESRATVMSITPQWKHDSDDYMTLECRVDASGDLETLSRFLYDIEKDPVALKLQSLELSSHSDNGQQMTLALQVSGLVLTPSGP
jgi:Tfp pilus assembly protein PilO